MKTYIKFPHKDGTFQDGQGVKFLLIEETPNTYASQSYTRLEGADENEAAVAGGLTAIPATPAPPAPVPNQVSPRQFRLAMLQVGVSPSDVTTAIDAIADPVVKAAAQVEWEYAVVFERDHALIASLAASMGLSSQDVDNIFRIAITK